MLDYVSNLHNRDCCAPEEFPGRKVFLRFTRTTPVILKGWYGWNFFRLLRAGGAEVFGFSPTHA
jgi:hypothetical protein